MNGSTNTSAGHDDSRGTFDLDAAIDAMRREDGDTEPPLAIGGLVAGLFAVPLVWLVSEVIQRWFTR